MCVESSFYLEFYPVVAIVFRSKLSHPFTVLNSLYLSPLTHIICTTHISSDALQSTVIVTPVVKVVIQQCAPASTVKTCRKVHVSVVLLFGVFNMKTRPFEYFI